MNLKMKVMFTFLVVPDAHSLWKSPYDVYLCSASHLSSFYHIPAIVFCYWLGQPAFVLSNFVQVSSTG